MLDCVLEGKLQIREFARIAQNYAVRVSDFVRKPSFGLNSQAPPVRETLIERKRDAVEPVPGGGMPYGVVAVRVFYKTQSQLSVSTWRLIKRLQSSRPIWQTNHASKHETDSAS